MPQLIEVPGMGTVEFPDGMNDSQIAAAIRRSMAQRPAAPAGPEEGMGKAMLIAAGRGTDKVVQGVRQGYNWLTGDQSALDQMARDEAEKDRMYKPLADKFPVATSIGEAVPLFAVPGGGTIRGAMLGAGALGATKYGTAEERLKRAGTDAVGAGLGAGAGKAVAHLLKPAGIGTQGASNAAVEAAERIGYRPTPAQITQNQGMAAFENYLARSPGSAGAMQRVTEANQTALNRAGAKAMGEMADTLDEGIFAAAQGRIGDEFTRLSQITKPKLGDDFINTLAKIDADNLARGPFANKQVSGLIDKGLELASKGDLDGKAYKEIRTALANEAQAAFKGGDATVGQAYKDVVKALDKAAKGSLSEADQKAWDAARQQWAAFKTLTKSNVAEGGNVSAARTAAAVRSKGPQLRTGNAQGELADIARIGEAFKGVPNPTSGQLVQQMVYGNPITGIPMMLGNRAAAAAYLSPVGQRYFSRGLLDVGEAGQGLLARAGSQGSLPLVRGLLGVE